MDLIKLKIEQAIGLLNEFDIDMWLVFVRETPMMADPVMPLLVGSDVTWQSFFIYTKSGDAIAVIGNFDEALFSRCGHFTRVIPYTQGVGSDIRRLLGEINPKSIALDFSTDDTGSDGLTHGMYLQLSEYLKETPFVGRFLSSEPICTRLRARKIPAEVDLLSKAANAAVGVWEQVVKEIKPGMSEIEIGAVIDRHIVATGGTPSFPTIVNAGDKSSAGHGHPTEARLARGDLLHVDFGVRLDDYCSDIQRLAYLSPQHRSVPDELKDAFDTVVEIITETGHLCKPGKLGYEVDAIARQMLRDSGFEEYQHALGHGLGRSVHDGGAILGPKWERYGRSPSIPLENGNVLTLELEIMLAGIGCVGLEEDIVVTDHGARFLCPRQMELVVL